MPDTDPITTLAEQIARLAAALDARTAPREGLTPTEAAAFLGISPAKLHQLDASGLIPSPAQIGDGRCPRYSASELRCWLLAGAPARLQWRAMRDASIRRLSA